MAAKSKEVSLGFFARAGAGAGKATAGCIGDLHATWDRHHGGVLTIASSSVSAGLIALATRVRVMRAGGSTALTAGRPVVLDQAADPDPRLVVVEQGPERIVLRVMFSLLDGEGGYHGDGLTETHIYHDGEVRLAFAFRLIDASVHDAVTDAWVEMNVAGKWRGATIGAAKTKKIPLDQPAGFSFRKQLPGRFVGLAGRKGSIAAGYYSLDGAATDALGGVGLWAGPRSQAPWYDTWGHLYDQWDGLAGWGGHPTGRLAIQPGGGSEGPAIRWHWLSGANEPCGANFGCKALLAIYFDRGAAAVDRLTGSFKPVVPRSATGLQFRCLDVVENVLLFRQTCPVGAAEFGPARAGRTSQLVRARVFDLDAFAGTRVRAAGKTLPVQRLSAGRMTDDPYGTNLARPGDRFVPLIGSENDPKAEAVFSFALSAGRATRIQVEQTAGLAMDYLKYDDREIYLLRSAAMSRGWPVAAFSPRTLCLHNLRLGGAGSSGSSGSGVVPPPAAVRVPLYWYPTNVQTRGHCANELVKLAISSDLWVAGRLRLAIQSTTPNRTLESRMEAELDVRGGFTAALNGGCATGGLPASAVNTGPKTLADKPPVARDTVLKQPVNPDGPRLSSCLFLDVSARLCVLKPFDLPEIQFLNLFPYDSWRTEDWESDWVISLNGEQVGTAPNAKQGGTALNAKQVGTAPNAKQLGTAPNAKQGGESLNGEQGATTYLIKEPYDKRRFGDQPQSWDRSFFLAQGPRDRGNLFLLARSAGPAMQKQRHVLCRVWLDSHLGVHGLPTPVPAGTKLAVDYTLAIGGDRRLSMAEAFEIGRAALKGGGL